MAEVRAQFCEAVGLCLQSVEQGVDVLGGLESALGQIIELLLVSRELVYVPLIEMFQEIRRRVTVAREAILVGRTCALLVL